MQQTNPLQFIEQATKIRRSPTYPIMSNYFILKAFRTIADMLKVTQTPYPLACDVNFFYESQNTKEYKKAIHEKLKIKFYQKKGITNLLKIAQENLQSFDVEFKDFDDFLKRHEKYELGSTILNVLEETMEKELEEKNFFNQDINDLLKFINPPMILATQERITIAESQLSDYEVGYNYGWLADEELRQKGFEIAGKKIKKEAKTLNIKELKNKAKSQEEFIENYEKNTTQEIKLFSENARNLAYAGCTAHKPVLQGRYKSRKIRTEIANQLGVDHIGVISFTPKELKTKQIDKERINAMKAGNFVILMNEDQEITISIKDIGNM